MANSRLLLKRLTPLMAALFLAACSPGGTEMTAGDAQERSTRTAQAFAGALVEGRYEKAGQMLVGDAERAYDGAGLEAAYREMIPEDLGPARLDGMVLHQDDWPGRQPGDLGWVYVSISTPEYGEAVTVVVAEAGGKAGVRSIEWGRP